MIGTGLGWAGDHFLGTTPWLMLVGVVIGMAAGLLNVYRYFQQLQKEE
jgi:ATP synthase protein I